VLQHLSKILWANTVVYFKLKIKFGLIADIGIKISWSEDVASVYGSAWKAHFLQALQPPRLAMQRHQLLGPRIRYTGITVVAEEVLWLCWHC